MKALRQTVLGIAFMSAGALGACSHAAKPATAAAPAADGSAPVPAASTVAPLVTPANVTLKPSKITYVARIFSEGRRTDWASARSSSRRLPTRANGCGCSPNRGRSTRSSWRSRSYVSKVNLEPVHRVVHTADMDITTHYTRDSILTSFEGDSGGGVRVALPNERNLVGNIYWIEPLLASLPLAPGWKGSATTVFVGPHDHARVEMQMAVVGQDSVLAPDGNFDCWKVTLKVGETEEHLWVRKADRVMIKEDTPVAGIAAAKVELLIAEGQTPKL